MYRCSDNNATYCFEKKALPKAGPVTPEKREEIKRMSQEIPEWMKVQMENLEYAGRVTHQDLSITINSPQPNYKI